MNFNPMEQGGIMGPRQKALIDQLQGGTAGPNTTSVNVPPIQAETPAPPPVVEQPPARTKDFSRLAGYDQGKFNANKNDAKYQIGGTLSQFDPTQGVTPDVVAALNQLGYGNFSGSGDKLNLSGLTDAGRQANLSGDYTGADFIQGFKGGNGKWGYSDPYAEAQQGGGGMMPPIAGDSQANISQALGGDQSNAFLQALIQQLSGGR